MQLGTCSLRRRGWAERWAGEQNDHLARHDPVPPENRIRLVTGRCSVPQPDGELVPADRRLAEIHDRYGPGHLVSRSIQRATPMILRAVEQVQDRAARSA